MIEIAMEFFCLVWKLRREKEIRKKILHHLKALFSLLNNNLKPTCSDTLPKCYEMFEYGKVGKCQAEENQRSVFPAKRPTIGIHRYCSKP